VLTPNDFTNLNELADRLGAFQETYQALARPFDVTSHDHDPGILTDHDPGPGRGAHWIARQPIRGLPLRLRAAGYDYKRERSRD
jgi:hypothetical protein